MSPSPPNATITLYVDGTVKGRAHLTLQPGTVILGAWVAIVTQGRRVRHLVFVEATTRTDAERALRDALGIPRRRLAFTPTSETQRAWVARTRL